ncbi:MAG: protein kinase domain-containing protein, partial [Acidimicrobiia bacterium]
MTDGQAILVRLCPNCRTERAASELYCEHVSEGTACQWELINEALYPKGQRSESITSPPRDGPSLDSRALCQNGHPMGPGDQICLTCGADLAPSREDGMPPDPTPETETVIDQWRILRRVPAIVTDARFETFVAQNVAGGPEVALVLYQQGAEPDPNVHDVLRRVPNEHIPTLLATGRYEDSTYEVTELVKGETLQSTAFLGTENPERLRALVRELADALASFAQLGLRHRDLHPGNILLRTQEPLDLVISGFGSARLSDFDLDAVAPLELTRYSAPEAIVGAVSAASDWWSLGVIILEQATSGQCFAGVNDQALRLHVVTRGISLPESLPADIGLLLRGLLARDPIARWSYKQVSAWLAGEPVDAPASAVSESDESDTVPIVLAGKRFSRPSTFALSAAEATNWEEGRDLVLRGAVATWIEEMGGDGRLLAEVRRISADVSLPDDLRHALVLMALNRALPLTQRGEIITPAWLINRPVEGYALITGQVVQYLERLGRDAWLVRMGLRVTAVRQRAELLEITLDEDRLRVVLLATSRAALEAERDTLRLVYPDTHHSGLASILDRMQLTDEDLIILISAGRDQYVPLESLADAALELALQVSLPLQKTEAKSVLSRPRRELFKLVDQRIANFARCGIEKIDEWADSFRGERRMPLPRAAVLLSLPAEKWQEPPK